MTIDPDLSLKALGRVAGPFGGDTHLAAAAVLRVANASMERALRVVSVERGHDPSLFTLVPFGGAGPLHACDLADSLRIPRILVPLYPGVLSALGMATAPVVKDLSASVLLIVNPIRPESAEAPEAEIITRLTRTRDELASRGRKELESEGFPLEGLGLQTFLDMRYLGQSYELSVPADTLDPPHFLARFHETHRERYGHADPARPVEAVNLRVRLVLPPPVNPRRSGRPEPAEGRGTMLPKPVEERSVWFLHAGATAAPTATPVYDRAILHPGHALDGPAIIAQMDSTTVVPPGWRGTVDKWENVLLERV